MCLCPVEVATAGVVVDAGGVAGQTVVVAAVVEVVVVAIFAVVCCCSWRKVGMLRHCVSDRRSSRSSTGVVCSPIGNGEVRLKSVSAGGAWH
jgi:hypothetical protein